MCHIDALQHACSIIRVYVADELCFHREITGLLCPVLQSQVDGTGTKVRSADTDLYHGGELLAGTVYDLACVYVICKICDLLLLCYIEISLVYAVFYHIVAQLGAGQVMQHQSLLTGIDHFAVIQLCKLLCQLCFFCQLGKTIQDIIIHCFCSIVISQTCCHRGRVLLYTFCSACAAHDLFYVYFCLFPQFLKCTKGVQVLPVCHFFFLRIVIFPNLFYIQAQRL